MNNNQLMFRFTLLVIDFVLMMIVDEKELKLMSGVAFIMLSISTLALLLY